MVSELARAFPKQAAEIGLLHRRGRIFPRARRLEWIAAWLDLPVDISGLSARPEQVFEAIVMGLELRIGDTPILDRQLRTARFEELLAVALLDMSLVDEVSDLKTEGLA